MMVLRRIGVLSAARLSGILGVAAGLAVGIVLAVVSVCNPLFRPLFGPFGVPGMRMGASAWGFVALCGGVFFPLIYGLFGALAGLIGAGLYNLLAPRVGGLRIELTAPTAHPSGIDSPAGTP
jgi:hypothetical protein